ncbi:MAG: hypothetical protein ABEJ44_00645 [Halanaeroarchaeum sp.]
MPDRPSSSEDNRPSGRLLSGLLIVLLGVLLLASTTDLFDGVEMLD